MTSAARDASVRRARALLAEGRLREAAEAFEEAARSDLARGEAVEASHGTRIAATTWRLAGEPARGAERARRAVALAPAGSRAAVAGLTEVGESSLAAGDAHGAAEAYDQALATLAPADAAAGVRAALERRRAVALAGTGRTDAALAALERAGRLHLEQGDARQALAARVEAAVALEGAGDVATAAEVARAARRAAEDASDHRALADLDLLACAHAVQAGDLDRARAAARAARAHAREAVEPVLYAGAALAEAHLAASAGDRLEAYAALASGWVTLGDLLGRELARLTFAPKLVELRSAWGAAAFAQVKAEYEAGRRAALARATSHPATGRVPPWTPSV